MNGKLLGPLLVGLMLLAGPVRTEESLEAQRTAADGGDAEAQMLLGIRHYRGDGGSKDVPEGVHWLRQAGGGEGAAHPRAQLCRRQSGA